MSRFVMDETDSLDAAARNLHDLLDVICLIQFDVLDGEVDRRVDSLLWIARDLSKGIIDKTGNEDTGETA